MEQQLREHFAQAVGDDPGVGAGEMARAAIAEGGRMRRRRHQLAAAGVVLVLGVAGGLSLGNRAAEQPVTVAAAMAPVSATSCTERPVGSDATDVMIFFGPEATGAVEAALRGDARIGSLVFESREQAYEKFRVRWADSPDFVAAVTVDSFPEAFRLRLVDPAQYTAVHGQYSAMDGVKQVVGRWCSADAPVGGTL